MLNLTQPSSNLYSGWNSSPLDSFLNLGPFDALCFENEATYWKSKARLRSVDDWTIFPQILYSLDHSTLRS